MLWGQMDQTYTSGTEQATLTKGKENIWNRLSKHCMFLGTYIRCSDNVAAE